MKYSLGDTITDGLKTYVLDRDDNWHYCDSGNHAEKKVSHKELLEIIGGKK